ncbi:DJ-1/PfpI family protein [Clostridium estertheticum]|uniref:DJ-1/PfpI family protein n=1 Tax=Clostridium estertheticum TaxID=238834 RepID=UPI001CF5812D|nr:DJ-1/PfpI family protein [Clostridium estertheticum]MCB2362086.1 DJ-1/PfpI family protein [Clostridium estertheticum]
MDVNILLFDDFETLDTFGAVEILGQVEEYRLRYFSVNGGIVLSKQCTKITTEQLKDADFSGILLIPGGRGTRNLVNDSIFIEQLTTIVAQSKYCLTVCTGSALLAKTNLLNGRNATSNKRAFEWVKSLNSNVQWENYARWVVDGKFYTSSGISAGIDMALGFVADIIGLERAIEIAQSIEYVWNCDKSNDLFAK